MSATNSHSAKHPDCEDRCQLREHKGYISCSQTGECAYMEQPSQSAPRQRLEAVLDEIEEYLGERQDTRDGEDGTPLPNKAMSLLTELDAARRPYMSFAPSEIATPKDDYNSITALASLLSAVQELAPPALATAIIVKAAVKQPAQPCVVGAPSDESVKIARQIRQFVTMTGFLAGDAGLLADEILRLSDERNDK